MHVIIRNNSILFLRNSWFSKVLLRFSLLVSGRMRLDSLSKDMWTNWDKMCLFFENFGFLGNPDNYTSKTTQSCGTSSPGIETIGTRRCFTRRIGQQKSFVRCEKTSTLKKKPRISTTKKNNFSIFQKCIFLNIDFFFKSNIKIFEKPKIINIRNIII